MKESTSMPTPTHYTRLAGYLQTRQFPLWATLPAGLLLVIIGIYGYRSDLAGILRTTSIVSIWLGVELVLVSWGLLCLQFWFQKREPLPLAMKLRHKFPELSDEWSPFFKHGGHIREWFMSLALDFWLICCILISIPILRALF